jgi:hypothetical protein
MFSLMAASNDYLRVTGKRLDTHPFAAQLDTCYSPEAVSNVLRTQAQAFKKFPKGDENLMTWLSPTVNILFAFSATHQCFHTLLATFRHFSVLFCLSASRQAKQEAKFIIRTYFTEIFYLNHILYLFK